MKIRVTPFVCVWIETPLPYHLFLRLPNHTLRGCMDWNRKQILFSEPTWKSHFYEKVPLIVNKLQRQKIWFGTFLSGLSFSIIQQTLVISVQNVSPPATAFVSSCHSIRLLLPQHSSPPVTVFDSFSYRIRLHQPLHSTPSANAAVSFCQLSRLILLTQSSPSANSVVSFSHRSRMCQLNEVDEVVKWSGWVRIMKFMISAQLSIHANGKAKSGLLLPLWFLYENVFSVFIITFTTLCITSWL